jgi:hypothetical protein
VGGTVSVAGSVSLKVVNKTSQASRGGSVTVSGDGKVAAASSSTSTAKAEPKGVTAGSVGFGASVALNLVSDTTSAAITDGTSLSLHSLLLNATNLDAMATDAKMGAAGGGVAVTPAVAVSFSNVSTSILIGLLTAGTNSITGDLTGAATQQAAVATTAGAVTTAGAAFGAGLALTFANHSVNATTLRDLSVGGNLTFSSDGRSASSTQATASAASAPGGSGAPAGGVTGQVLGERSAANGAASANGVGDSGGTPTPAASTNGGGSGGDVSAAAAVAVNIANVSSRASLPPVRVAAGGQLRLAGIGNSNAMAVADGSAAVSSSGAAIGAGVAINLANVN